MSNSSAVQPIPPSRPEWATHEDVEKLGTRVGAVEVRLGIVEAKVDRVTEDVKSLTGDVKALSVNVQKIATNVSGLVVGQKFIVAIGAAMLAMCATVFTAWIKQVLHLN